MFLAVRERWGWWWPLTWNFPCNRHQALVPFWVSAAVINYVPNPSLSTLYFGEILHWWSCNWAQEMTPEPHPRHGHHVGCHRPL